MSLVPRDVAIVPAISSGEACGDRIAILCTRSERSEVEGTGRYRVASHSRQETQLSSLSKGCVVGVHARSQG